MGFDTIEINLVVSVLWYRYRGRKEWLPMAFSTHNYSSQTEYGHDSCLRNLKKAV